MTVEEVGSAAPLSDGACLSLACPFPWQQGSGSIMPSPRTWFGVHPVHRHATQSRLAQAMSASIHTVHCILLRRWHRATAAEPRPSAHCTVLRRVGTELLWQNYA